MSFSDPLGAATVARFGLCRPNEQLLWATYRKVLHYDIEGLEASGRRRKGPLRRGGYDVVASAVSGVHEILGGDGILGAGPPAPDLLVFGPAPGCHAHQAGAGIAAPGRPQKRLWVLTSTRLAVFKVGGPQSGEPEDGSLVDKAARFGKGLVDAGKGIAELATDTRERYGDNIEGEPITAPEWSTVTEFRREHIAGVAVVERGDERNRPCIRVSLMDGSGFDFLLPEGDPAMLEYIAVLTSGTR
ncbi:hypothetical protein [Actinomadura sp. HBU206391]|uniref:hypothetical protein n=1 Tax=Actinomadura sp. HBU206391 TaxID=2731692 RepID=UPI00164F114F|nr:hypothetical protein [Actinomadura sp. HBU206391]MBC6456665.1 hypothetical protein [Actinomadura sp. HBU206391]